MSSDEQADPRWTLHGLITGHYLSRAVYVAAKLGIADLLKDGPREISELAAATSSHLPSLHRLMSLLSGAGVFAQGEAGYFRITPVGRSLQSDAPGSQRAEALLFAGPYQQRAWSRLLEIVRTGQQPSSQTLFPFLGKHQEEAEVFYAAMAAKTESIVDGFLAAYDTSRFSTIVELGAGYGALLRAILKTNPHQRGTLFDLPAVAAEASARVQADGLTERCEMVSGDLFDALPRDGDAYILKNVIHDWADEDSLAILRNVAEAMKPDSTVLLVEMIVPPRPCDRWSDAIARSDLNMLVNTGGRERSASEFQGLFEAAGLELSRIVPTPTPWSIVEGHAR